MPYYVNVMHEVKEVSTSFFNQTFVFTPSLKFLYPNYITSYYILYSIMQNTILINIYFGVNYIYEDLNKELYFWR